MWRRLCRALGRPELAEDPDFVTDPDRSRNRARLNAILGDIFRTATTEEWSKRLAEADVPSGPIYTMDQVFADPQVRHAEVAAPLEHPRRGPIRVVNQVVGLERTPASIVMPLEDKGASNDDVLAELGLSAATIAELRSQQVI